MRHVVTAQSPPVREKVIVALSQAARYFRRVAQKEAAGTDAVVPALLIVIANRK